MRERPPHWLRSSALFLAADTANMSIGKNYLFFYFLFLLFEKRGLNKLYH